MQSKLDHPAGEVQHTNVKLNDQARQAWAVKFVVPTPQAMPSDRLKARAKLVRSALGSHGY